MAKATLNTTQTVNVELSLEEARALTALAGKCGGNLFISLWTELSNVVGRNVSKAFDITGSDTEGNNAVPLYSISIKDVGYPVTQ